MLGCQQNKQMAGLEQQPSCSNISQFAVALRLVVLVCVITDGPHQWPRVITRLFGKADFLLELHLK